ncbi:MAG: hypothetical protein ACR2OG_06090 [Gemmatimonadaceae bacterium]
MRRISGALLLAAMWGCSKDGPPTQPQLGLGKAAQSNPSSYAIVKLPTLGGTSRGDGINDRGWVAGFSNLPGNTIRHATLWQDGSILDLGTLGGPNSSVVWPGINNQGTIAGISETAALDPLGESWSCSAFFPTGTGHICLGFVWDAGVMTALPTLGGNNGFATGVNSRGQVVGWAETPVHDPTCNAPQVLQFRAVLWEPRKGLTTQLSPLPGDSTSAATAINNRGQVVGISGTCDVAVGEFSAAHAVLWDKGTVTDIGNLGGVAWNTPMAINASGDVVGFSDPPGDADGSFIAHAFLWTRKSGIADLGTLPGDDISEALSINARGQIVGLSCGAAGCRAFIWQDGTMIDLNTLAGPGYPDNLISAQDINDAGRITGRVREQSTGRTLAFVATPVPNAP